MCDEYLYGTPRGLLMTKIRRNISIDEEVWELAKIRISEPLSCFIQKQLELACNLADDKLEIEKELYEKEQEVLALRSQLEKINKEEMLKKKANYNLEKCIPAITRIHEIHNVIGENQICKIAMAHDVNCDVLIQYCVEKGFNVVPLFDFNRETNKMNGGGW